MLSEPIAGQRVTNAQSVAHGDDSGLLVTFHKVAQKNEAESLNAGRPIFRDVDFVKIITPGDSSNIYDQPAKPHHKERFPRQWEQYKRGEEQASDGTPLEAWPRMTPSKIAAYKFANVFTVEAVATIADANASHMPMDFMDDRVAARAYLLAAEDSAYAQRMAAENAAKDAEIAQLRATVADLGKRMDAIADAKSDKGKKA